MALAISSFPVPVSPVIETFMLDFYEVDYAGENEDGEEEEFSGTLYDCMQKFNIASFRKEWKMEDISANWEGFDVFIFNDSASEESYDDIYIRKEVKLMESLINIFDKNKELWQTDNKSHQF